MGLSWRLPSEFLGAFIRLLWLKPISPGSFSFPVIFMPPPCGSIDSQVLTYSPPWHPSAVTRLAHHNPPSAFTFLFPPPCCSLFRKLLLTFLLLPLLGPLLLAPLYTLHLLLLFGFPVAASIYRMPPAYQKLYALVLSSSKQPQVTHVTRLVWNSQSSRLKPFESWDYRHTPLYLANVVTYYTAGNQVVKFRLQSTLAPLPSLGSLPMASAY